MLEIISDYILWAIGLVTAVIGFYFACRRFLRSTQTIRIEPSYNLNLDGNERDKICATVTNSSNETIYLVDCTAIGVFSRKSILLTHLLHPLTKPRLYSTFRYDMSRFSLKDEKPIKLEPGEPVSLEHKMIVHPLSLIRAPYFFIRATLSSGRKIDSIRLETPSCWKEFKDAKDTDAQTVVAHNSE